jgi:hypothetical protein
MKFINFFRPAVILFLAWGCVLPRVGAMNTAAVDEVLKLKNAGVAEDTITAFIQSKNLKYELSADNLLQLRAQGVPPVVLNAMLVSGAAPASPPVPTPPPPPTAPQPQPIPTQPIVSTPQPMPGTLPAAGTPTFAPALAPAPVTNPDVAYFYQELTPYGRWILAEDGQWCWQPSTVASSPGWRPYWDKGHWLWTDHGWYWVSDYPWGWATFHYGRWNLHPHLGWIWYPDRVWGPAWVVWRTGGEYCGWAPLPPGAVYDTAGAHFIFHGKSVSAGFDFGLGAAHFNFCYTREMGAPTRQHFHNDAEVHTIFNHTTIINTYSVNRQSVGGETRLQVVNHGIDPARLPPVKGRPLQAVHIEDLRTPAPGRAHEHLDPHSQTLEVYRPKFGDHH